MISLKRPLYHISNREFHPSLGSQQISLPLLNQCIMSYIADIIAKNGLSESELEDILSCDNDVLNDVYVYWTPPIRRLPPLLMVRLRTDLSSYLGKC